MTRPSSSGAATRRIGLSLGADLCWPRSFEGILRRWNPTLRVGGEDLRFEVDRVTIEPFDLRGPVKYDVVLDRLTHWYANTREWIKKAVLMDDLYVLNNPWAVQSMEKQTSYCAMMRLGMPIPDTWLIPPKEYDETPDLQPTLERYARALRPGGGRREGGLSPLHEALRRRGLGESRRSTTPRRSATPTTRAASS